MRLHRSFLLATVVAACLTLLAVACSGNYSDSTPAGPSAVGGTFSVGGAPGGGGVFSARGDDDSEDKSSDDNSSDDDSSDDDSADPAPDPGPGPGPGPICQDCLDNICELPDPDQCFIICQGIGACPL